MTFTTEVVRDSLKTLSTTILNEIFRLKIIFFQTVHCYIENILTYSYVVNM